MTAAEIPPAPDGYSIAAVYPQPGDQVLVWDPPLSVQQPGTWVPARIKDRRVRGFTAREVCSGTGTRFPVRSRPVHHYAHPTPHDTTPTATRSPGETP